MPADPTEIEAKLGVDDPHPIRGLIERPDPSRLAGFEPVGPVEVHEVVDRYLDTAPRDGVLLRAGYRARLRTTRRRTTLTVKGERQRRGFVSERLELEGPATLRLDPESWPPSPARDRLVAILASGAGPRQRLREIASLGQRRRVRVVRRGATVVELSLDELVAPANDRRRRGVPPLTRTELELELKAGDRRDLVALTDAIRRVPGLREPAGSKRDFALAAPRSVERRRAAADARSRAVNGARTAG